MSEIEAGAQEYHLSPLRSLLLSALCVMGAVFMVWIVLMSPCDSSLWTSAAADQSCERLVSWGNESVSWDTLVAREFIQLPTWLKIILASPFVLVCLFLGIRALVYGLDGRPDFVISREGVTHLDGGKQHKYKWEEISEIAKVNFKQKTIFGNEKGTGWNLVFRSKLPSRPGILGFVSKSVQEVELGVLFSEMQRAQICDLARLYAPDIPFVEKTRIIERPQT